MGGRILIVDDEQLIRELLSEALDEAGYETATAEEGGEALEKLARTTYDLVVTDAVMPGMSGLELLRRIKKDRPKVRVLIITGHAREHDIAEFLLSGADEYMSKPIRIEEFKRVVEKALGAPR